MPIPSRHRPTGPPEPPLPDGEVDVDGVEVVDVEVVGVEVVGDLAARRRAALRAARAEVFGSPAGGTPAGSGIALRGYGPGCLVLALGGTFAVGDVDRVRSLDPVLRRLATVELVMELSTLRTCDRVLARALARVRIRALVAGACVEMHGPPAGLGAEIDGIDDRQVWT